MHETTAAQRTTYLRGLLQRYGTLSLPLGSGLSFSLIQVFQPLRLRQSAAHDEKQPEHNDEETPHATREEAGEQDEAREREEPVERLAENGLEALNKSPRGRMVILGSPGMGKTTVLKHLLYHYAQLALEDSTAALPVFLSLPDLARAGQDLDFYLMQVARDMGLEAAYGQAISGAIQQGHAFVCLDSLDEVLPRLRAGIIRLVNMLAQKSGNTWIVGSRFTDYKGGQFQQGQFQEWELQALDEPRRLQLAMQLLPELQRQLPSPNQPANTLHPHDYVQALSTHRQAATWGENPLLFSLGAVVYLRRGNLSGSRAMLYREVIDALLETREGETHQREQLRHILADTALELYQARGRTFSTDDLRATLTRLDTEQHATWSIDDILYRVLNSGLLDVVAYETYSFHHSTFQEYLVASALAQRFMSEDEQVRDAAQRLAWSKYTYSRWSEIECLLVGILVQEYGAAGTLQARAWLERLLQQQTSSAGDPGNLSLELAIKALSEVAALVEWQAAETLELEVMAATRWISRLNWLNKLFYTKRRRQQELLALAHEIGHLRPAAQHAAVDGILNGSYYNIGPTLGAMHSPIAAERMRTAWQNISHPCAAFLYTFTLLGEYAPVDLLFPALQTPSAHLAVKILKNLGRYTPVNELISLLGNASRSIRQQAAEVLCAIASAVVLPTKPLLSLLQQEQTFAFPAVRVLARLQHPAAIEPAIAALTNPDWQTRQDAVQALGCFKTPPLTGSILPLLKDTDYSVRKGVLEALGGLGPDAPAATLLVALQDSDEEVRMAAVQALGNMNAQAPISALVEMLHDTDSEVVTTTLQVLGKMGNRAPIPNLLDMLHHHHSDVIHQAIKTLGEPHIIEHVPIEPLLQFYREHWYTRSTMLETLGKAADRLPSSFLINALNDSYYDTVIIAAQLLGQRKRRDSDEALLAEISAHAWQLCGHAVKILAAYSAEDYLAYLLHALFDETLRVSNMAAEELGKIADHIPMSALMEALQHAFPWVRTYTLNILAKRTSPPAPEILSTALRDPHEQVRAAAASAAGNWTANAPIEQLVNVTTDRFENVRFAAARSLAKIGLNDPVKSLQGLLNVLCYPEFMEDPNDYRSINLVSEALSIIAPHAPVEPLYQAMHDLHKRNDDWLARTAARALGEQGARAPIAQLVSDLHSQDANMRMLAVIALGKTGVHAPIAELIQALDNPPHVRAEVLRVLCALSTAVPGDLFLRLLRNEKHKHHIFLGLLLALKNIGETVPSDLLLQALQSNELWPPPMAEEFLSYLCSLNPLPLPTPTLIAGLATFLTHYQPSEAAVEKLRAALLPRLPLPALLATLAQKNAIIRRGGLILLSYVPDNVPLEPLLTALRDPSPGVRQAAIYCIWVHADRLPASPLSVLLQDGNTDVRKSAIKTLAAAGADAPINDLVTLLDDTDYNVQCTAIETLCQPAIARITPVEVFVRALEFANVEGHSNAKVHKMVLQVLCDKDPHIAITHCIAALGDSNSEIALTAFQILQKISPATIPEIVQEATALLEGGKPKHFFRTLSMRFLANVIGDMGQAAPDLIARLGELLDWPYWEVRMKAVQALGKLRRNIPDATIRRLLELRHDLHSRAVREAADEALAEILSLETGIEDD